MLIQTCKSCFACSTYAIYTDNCLVTLKKSPRPRDIRDERYQGCKICLNGYVPISEENAPNCNFFRYWDR